MGKKEQITFICWFLDGTSIELNLARNCAVGDLKKAISQENGLTAESIELTRKGIATTDIAQILDDAEMPITSTESGSIELFVTVRRRSDVVSVFSDRSALFLELDDGKVIEFMTDRGRQPAYFRMSGKLPSKLMGVSHDPFSFFISRSLEDDFEKELKEKLKKKLHSMKNVVVQYIERGGGCYAGEDIASRYSQLFVFAVDMAGAVHYIHVKNIRCGFSVNDVPLDDIELISTTESAVGLIPIKSTYEILKTVNKEFLRHFDSKSVLFCFNDIIVLFNTENYKYLLLNKFFQPSLKVLSAPPALVEALTKYYAPDQLQIEPEGKDHPDWGMMLACCPLLFCCGLFSPPHKKNSGEEYLANLGQPLMKS